MIVNSVVFKNLNEDDQLAAGRVGVIENRESLWVLSRNAEGFLCLSFRNLPKIKPIFVDFCSGKSIFKRHSLLNKKQIITKAVSFKKKGDRLLDLTAGFGEDAALFAAMGFQVTAIERQPLMYLLLQDAWNRFATFDSEDVIISQKRLKFIFSEATEYLNSLNEKYDCIYVDPMFSEDKSALSSGRMQILQYLTEDEPFPSKEFFELALKHCQDRLVIKRPLKSENLLDGPTHGFKGKTVRYDMYKPS